MADAASIFQALCCTTLAVMGNRGQLKNIQ
jgi:hypothetical protein